MKPSVAMDIIPRAINAQSGMSGCLVWCSASAYSYEGLPADRDAQHVELHVKTIGVSKAHLGLLIACCNKHADQPRLPVKFLKCVP